MNSCAASSYICSPRASFVSVTSASWPTADAPPYCRFASQHWAQFLRRSNQKPPPPRNRTPSPTIDSCSHTLVGPLLLFRADSRPLQHLSFAPFNLHKARVRRASGFLLTAFSNARPNLLFRSTLLTKGAPPKKHWRHPTGMHRSAAERVTDSASSMCS